MSYKETIKSIKTTLEYTIKNNKAIDASATARANLQIKYYELLDKAKELSEATDFDIDAVVALIKEADNTQLILSRLYTSNITNLASYNTPVQGYSSF